MSVGFVWKSSVVLFKIFRNLVDFFLRLSQDGRQERRYEGGFNCFFTFGRDLGFGDLRTELRLDFVSESCFVVVHKEIIPVRIVNCRNKFL